MTLDAAYHILYSTALIAFGVLIGAMLIRAVIGPRITDRILSINMIGTMVISCIAVLSLLLKEAYLLDVAMIYVLISFITVLIFARTYIPGSSKRKAFGREAFYAPDEEPAEDAGADAPEEKSAKNTAAKLQGEEPAKNTAAKLQEKKKGGAA